MQMNVNAISQDGEWPLLKVAVPGCQFFLTVEQAGALMDKLNKGIASAAILLGQQRNEQGSASSQAPALPTPPPCSEGDACVLSDEQLEQMKREYLTEPST